MMSVVTTALVGDAGAEPVADRRFDHIAIRNDGVVPVVALRVGPRAVGYVGPREDREIRTPQRRLDGGAQALVVSGRFRVRDWSGALDVLDPDDAGWAPYHLRTAGHLLDALAPGPSGEPGLSAGWRELATLTSTEHEALAASVRPPALRMALLARAARHVPPGPLLAALFDSVAPEVEPETWSAPYAGLAPLPTLIRLAFEAHGAAAVPLLASRPAWARDRGFAPEAVSVGDGGPRWIAHPIGAANLSELIDSGQFEMAAMRAAATVSTSTVADDLRAACRALDFGIWSMSHAGRHTSATALLNHAFVHCPAEGRLISRWSEVERSRGDAAFARGDLGAAVIHFGRAWDRTADAFSRVRYADTLAELAILRFADGELEQGRAYLRRAAAVDDARPRIYDARALLPRVDDRVRMGLIIILCGLLFYVARRVRRIFVSPMYVPGTIVHRRGPKRRRRAPLVS